MFGGGNVMPNMTATRVGERNAQFVTEYLRREQIPIVAQDLLGDLPRKQVLCGPFDVATSAPRVVENFLGVFSLIRGLS